MVALVVVQSLELIPNRLKLFSGVHRYPLTVDILEILNKPRSSDDSSEHQSVPVDERPKWEERKAGDSSSFSIYNEVVSSDIFGSKYSRGSEVAQQLPKCDDGQVGGWC